MDTKIYKSEFFGRELVVDFSDLAERTNNSAIIRYGDTVVLITAVMGQRETTTDHFPLTVEYEEKFYAAGKIIGSRFIRREGRPSDEAVLTGRLIDRAIRPLFSQNLRREVQVVCTVLSLGDVDADWPAFFGASLVLATSDIPWAGPIAGLRLAKVDGQIVFCPTFEQRLKSEFDAFYAGDANLINMMEFGGSSVPEDLVMESLEMTQKEFAKIIDFQKKIIEEINPVKIIPEEKEVNEDLKKVVLEFLDGKLEEAIYTPNASPKVANLTILRDDLMKHIAEKGFSDSDFKAVSATMEEEIDKIVSENILKTEMRPDKRGLKDVRKISCEIDILPRVHGSAIFKRGSTHALSSVTLGGPSAEQMIETIELSGTKRFIHHYNFPPYSTGEVGSLRRGPGRRELGHGNLAEKALFAIIPAKNEFPYTVRVVSEILSSNGSSSMASVCGSCLALMAAGVPIKNPVAGIAMGLVMGDNENEYKILTDIQGPEDHHGDMDLKVAGTKDGINAMQMDVKINGVTLKILKETFQDAKTARLHILKEMEAVIPEPRKELSPFAPKISIVKIDPDKIGLLIGAGGKTINKIVETTGVASIDIDDDGSVFIVAQTDEALLKGLDAVSGLTKEFKVGEVVEGTVSKILDFGAVVDLNPWSDGLLHISEMANFRVGKTEDIVRMGDKITVKIINIDTVSGKISLSLKALIPDDGSGRKENGNGFHESRFMSFGGERKPGGPMGYGGQRRESRGPQRRR